MPDHAPILLAEDTEDDAILICRAFRQAGMCNPIHRVSNGQEAISYLMGEGKFRDRKAFPLPCVLLCDLKMPGKSGIDVLRWVRRQPGLKRLVVVMMTASNHRQDIDLCYDLGANSYLIKPLGTAELLEMVKRFKTYWLATNQPPEIA
jgi:CheY-like chemotaxis protein